MQLIIVVTAAQQHTANQAANAVDDGPDNTTFNVPLRAAGDQSNTIAAYWCSWGIDTPDRAVLLARLGNPTVIEPGASVPQTGPWVFDGDTWTPDQVLGALALARPLEAS